LGTPRLVDACRELKFKGYRLALDDFTWNASQEPLVRLVDYIRVDYNALGIEERQHLKRLKSDSVALIAGDVKTQQDYRRAVADGFTLFHGEYFRNPELLKRSRIPANPGSHFDIVRLLCNDPIDVRRISQLVMRDAALTHRLLRLVNSPLYAIQNDVRSIESAIMILGDHTFRRVVSLAILSELNAEQPPEIMHLALVRARFCEMTARLCGLESAEQYLLGMFSLVPAMLRAPMKEITRSLPLRKPVCEALEGVNNRERSLLSWVEFHEHGNWIASDSIAESIGLGDTKLNLFYAEAVVWAQTALSSAASRK
jgi:EAL and modified HD-GYP domain-containing signal transduction protein